MKTKRTNAKDCLLMLAAGTASALAAVGEAHAATAWTDLGGSFSGNTPAATRTVENGSVVIDVYGIENGTGKTLHMRFDNTGHTGWNNIGGVSISSPTAIVWPGHREVFVVGTDHHLYHATAGVSGVFSLYQPLNGPEVCSDPSAVSWGPGRVDVFMMGCTAHHLIHVAWAGSAWNWVDRGVIISSVPSACSPAGARLDVWVIDAAGHLRDHQYNGSSWAFKDTNKGGLSFASCGTPDVATTNNSALGMGIGNSAPVMAFGDIFSPLSSIVLNWDWGPPTPQLVGALHATSSNTTVWFYGRTAGAGIQRISATFSQTNTFPRDDPEGIVNVTDTFSSDPVPVCPDPTVQAVKVFVVKNGGQMGMLDDTPRF